MSQTRPGAVTTACGLLVLGSVLLVAGGLLAGLVSFESLRQTAPPAVSDDAVRAYARLYRGGGILFAVAGVALAWFAGLARRRDLRARRAAMALGLAVIVLVAAASVLSGTHILALLGLLPIVVGVLLLSRPAVVDWYAGG
jgi:hypothetical protein